MMEDRNRMLVWILYVFGIITSTNPLELSKYIDFVVHKSLYMHWFECQPQMHDNSCFCLSCIFVLLICYILVKYFATIKPSSAYNKNQINRLKGLTN